MMKQYTEPKFTFVKTDESNKAFFATSGTPGPAPTMGGSLGSMSNTNGGW